MDLTTVVYLLIELLVIGLIFYVVWWGWTKIAPPEPINKIGQAIIIVVMVIVLVYILFGFLGAVPHPIHIRR